MASQRDDALTPFEAEVVDGIVNARRYLARAALRLAAGENTIIRTRAQAAYQECAGILADAERNCRDLPNLVPLREG